MLNIFQRMKNFFDLPVFDFPGINLSFFVLKASALF